MSIGMSCSTDNCRSIGKCPNHLNKAETAAKYGDEQVKIWRRSYDVLPPLLEKDDERYPARDPRYASLDPKELPAGECLADTVARVVP